jgi:hypothetical protein
VNLIFISQILFCFRLTHLNFTLPWLMENLNQNSVSKTLGMNFKEFGPSCTLNISNFQIHISDGIPSKDQVCEVDSCDYIVLHPLLSPIHRWTVAGHPGSTPHQVQDRPADGAPLLADDTQQPGQPLDLHLVQQEHTFCSADQQ